MEIPLIYAESRLFELTVGSVDLGRRFPAIVGKGPAIRSALAVLDRVATSDVPVLLVGETGTGKEVFARALHTASRRKGAFIGVNCGAIPGALFEAEIMGYRRGAFTGAVRDHVGLVEQASGGTLLLDEVADLPLDLQPKLLRLLAEHSVRPLGADSEVAVDVRVVAACHADLADAVAKGRFRADLFHRLRVIELRIPPLRDRPGDIRELAGHLLEQRGRAGQTITPKAIRRLEKYAWPGNVRELENEIVRASLLAGGGPIEEKHLSRPVAAGTRRPERRDSTGSGTDRVTTFEAGTRGRSLAERATAFERKLLEAALAQVGGSRAKAAKLLRVPERTLFRKLRAHGIAAK